MLLHKSAGIGLAAAGFLFGSYYSAKADVVLPVQNLQFNQLGGSFSNFSQKDFFNTVMPLSWSVGAAGAGGSLTYVGLQGSEGLGISNPNIYPVYTNPGFSVTVPAGTNFFQADGNPRYENTIFQSIPGLTPGVTYSLQFQQAAGQQVGFDGDTTEQWKVFLGVGGIGTNCGPNPCVVTGLLNNIENDSTLTNTPSHQNVDWNSVTMTFTPGISNFTSYDAGTNTGTAILTFLAWGDGGNTTNLPPTVFLEGVNTTPIPTPEPTTLSILGFGLLGLAEFRRRRRAKRNAVV